MISLLALLQSSTDYRSMYFILYLQQHGNTILVHLINLLWHLHLVMLGMLPSVQKHPVHTWSMCYLVYSKEETSQIPLKLPAVPLLPYSPFPHWDLKGIYACRSKQGFFPSQHLLLYFYILLNIPKTKTKPTLPAVLEIGFMEEPQGDGSIFQHGVTMDKRSRSWSAWWWGKKGCWKVR